MILFDPKAKGVSTTTGTKKQAKKEKAQEAKFVTGKKVDDAKMSYDAKEVANIAPMLFLQEIDEYRQDKEELEDFAQKAFKGLKELQLAVISGHLDEKHLLNLQASLERRHKFVTPELQALAEEIEIRIAVEIAKLERARS